MTKTAASQTKMNTLHDRVADIFLKVLQRYETRMDVVDGMASGSIDMQELNEEILTELFNDGSMPSPSMMAAVTKFLKDNEVLFEKDKLEAISDQQRALEEKRKNRPKLTELTLVPKVVNE